MKSLNTRFRNIKSLVLVVPVFAVILACNDFLEPDSLSTFDLAYVYSNVDDARSGVNAIYRPFGNDGFRSRLSNNMTGNTDIEAADGWSSTDNGRRDIWDLDASSANGDLNQFWQTAYEAIRNANISIEGLEASDALNSSDATVSKMMHHMLGEAYTLRAYWYSMLCFHFGDVPFVTEAPKAGANFLIPRNNRNEILSSVIQDMIDIEEDMLWADELPYGIEQVNREYTLALIARIALQRGGYYLTPDLEMVRDESGYAEYYDLARTYTSKLMTLKDRDLPGDFRQVFLNNAKLVTPVNDDILFEIPFGQNNGDVAWNIGIDVKGGPTASHQYGSGGNYMNIPATYYVSFDTLDQRRDVTCGLYYVDESFGESYIGCQEKDGSPCQGDGRGANGISQGKWSRHFLDEAPGPLSAKGTGINWPMMRYPDVLLMFAEAENELNGGPTSAAKEALKRVRRRAFDESVWGEKVDTYVNSLATQQDFFDAIVWERAWEFGGEMIRKYELIRWNLYYEKVYETVEGLKDLAEYAFNGVALDPSNDLFRNNTIPPKRFYWKRDANGDFTILNRNADMALPPTDPSWIEDDFLIDLYQEDLTNKDFQVPYQDWIIGNWRNYIDPTGWTDNNTVRYIFPIPQSVISSSQGYILNTGDQNNYPGSASYYEF